MFILAKTSLFIRAYNLITLQFVVFFFGGKVNNIEN